MTYRRPSGVVLLSAIFINPHTERISTAARNGSAPIAKPGKESKRASFATYAFAGGAGFPPMISMSSRGDLRTSTSDAPATSDAAIRTVCVPISGRLSCKSSNASRLRRTSNATTLSESRSTTSLRTAIERVGRWGMLAMGATLLALSAAPAQAQFTCLPTCETAPNDAKFLAVAGNGLATLSDRNLEFAVIVPAGTASFTLGIFDGESGSTVGGSSRWDFGPETPFTYSLFNFTYDKETICRLQNTQFAKLCRKC